MQSDRETLSIAVVGHKGAGKTALIAAMAYVAQATPRLGKAGDYALGLDDTPEEKAHQSTFETHLVNLSWMGARLQLLDTPGEIGFFADTQLAFLAADSVLLVVSARAGVEATTQRLVRLILESNKPCFIAVTRCDEAQIRVEEVVQELRALKEPITLVEVPHHRSKNAALDGVVSVTSMKAWLGHPEGPSQTAPDPIPGDVAEEVRVARERVVDEVAGTDDDLANHYLERGDLTQTELTEGEHRAVAQGKLVPVLFTSAATPFGIVALLNALVEFAPRPAERAAFEGEWESEPAERQALSEAALSGLVLKTKVDSHGRLSLVRVLSGTLRADSHVLCAETGEQERIGLFARAMKDPRDQNVAQAGELVVIPKLKNAPSRSTLCDPKHPIRLRVPDIPVALFSRAIVMPRGGPTDKVAQALNAIHEEDRGLSVTVDGHQLVISGLGATHLDITIERLKRRTKLDLGLGPPRIEYRETISRKVEHVEGRQKKQSGGHGEFGIVYLDVEPLPRGQGYVFEDAVVGGKVPRQYVGSVKQGVERALQRGVLAGYPLVDVKVRLTDGKHHSVDSSDAAFQTAGYRGFLAAARAASPILLEPIAKLNLCVPLASLGDVLGDLAAHRGTILGQWVSAGESTIEALLPFAELVNYEPRLSAHTQGRGSFGFGFAHYDQVSAAAQAEVVSHSEFLADVNED